MRWVLGIAAALLVIWPQGCDEGDDDDDDDGTAHCVDSDGGKNYYELGSLSGICPGEDCGAWVDSCMSNGNLSEYFCDDAEEHGIGHEEYVCPHGCEDGVCIDGGAGGEGGSGGGAGAGGGP